MNPSTTPPLRILLLEDSDFDTELIIRAIRRGGVDFVYTRVQTQEEFLKGLEEFNPDIILADYRLPLFDGSKALKIAKEHSPEVPVLVVSGTVGEETAVDLLRNGATDFVLKDRLIGRLVPAVRRAMSEVRDRRSSRESEVQREQLNRELRHLASHDHLTGAAARPLVLEKLAEAIAEINPLNPDSIFFFIDLDRFKWVNNNYGSTFGDQLLVEIARRLYSICRPQDLIGNFGGDKFSLLIRHINLREELPSLLDRITKCFEKPFAFHDLMIQVRASIAGVILKAPDITVSDVMLQAGEAMRLVKNNHLKKILIADEGLIRELQRRNTLDQKMVKALEHNRLFIAYQPIVDLVTGKAYGAEVLLRCRQEDGSVLPAAEFIESLERMKYMPEVDEWVFSHYLESVAATARPLLKRKNFRFSLNVSPSLFTSMNYAEKTLARLKTAGIPPTSLILEILEGSLFPTESSLNENLEVLRKAGVLIAIDDFGTGYSNLTRLSRLPIDEVKIDRAFLGGIVKGDSHMNAVLSAAVGVAKNLGYQIVAEGVEEQVEVDYLKKLGCRYAQGYLFGKAMPLEDLLLFVESHE